MNHGLSKLFRLDNKVIVITGAAGLLGIKHAHAIASHGGIPVMLDIAKDAVEKKLSPQTPRIPPTPPPSPTNIKYDSNNINEVREQLDHANRKIAEYQVLLNSRE